jgi:hypothetical protein
VVTSTINHNTECRFFAPEVLPPRLGSQRVALNSIFRIICEANQLTVNDVLNAFSVPILGVPKDKGSSLFRYLRAANVGSQQSARLIQFLERTTGLNGLLSLTLRELWQPAGAPAIRIAEIRRWCPHCFFKDVSSGLPPYDRLLWSIDLVRYCPVHNVPLAIVCPGCRRSTANYPFKFDVSGFCPWCMAWLGNRTVPSAAADDDEQARHGIWSANAFADILEITPFAGVEVLPSIRRSIRKLATVHHAGTSAHFARQIGRNKSVVATWLAGGSCPRWDALSDISYVYQQPLTLLLQGKVSDLTASEPRALPNYVRSRHGNPRESPVSREPAVVAAFLNEVAAGIHPSISSVSAAAQRLGMDVREVYRLAQEAAKNASAALEARSVLHRAAQAARRSQARDSAIGRVATSLASRGCKLTRRVVDDEMARQGYVVRWSESKEVMDLVRQQTKSAQAKPPT